MKSWRRAQKIGSARNEVRVDNSLDPDLLFDAANVAIEPDRLIHISLGQENPRTRMKGGPDELNQRAVGRLGVSPPWGGFQNF